MFLFEKGVNDLIWEDSSTLDRWHSSMVDTVEFLRATNRETNESRPGDCLPERNTYCNSDLLYFFFSKILKMPPKRKLSFQLSPLHCCVIVYCAIFQHDLQRSI